MNMSTFAHMNGNVVMNLIYADSLEQAEAALGVGSCIEYTDHWTVGVGWTYDPEANTFTAPTEG